MIFSQFVYLKCRCSSSSILSIFADAFLLNLFSTVLLQSSSCLFKNATNERHESLSRGLQKTDRNQIFVICSDNSWKMSNYFSHLLVVLLSLLCAFFIVFMSVACAPVPSSGSAGTNTTTSSSYNTTNAYNCSTIYSGPNNQTSCHPTNTTSSTVGNNSTVTALF